MSGFQTIRDALERAARHGEHHGIRLASESRLRGEACTALLALDALEQEHAVLERIAAAAWMVAAHFPLERSAWRPREEELDAALALRRKTVPAQTELSV